MTDKRSNYWNKNYLNYWKSRVHESGKGKSKIIKDDPNTEDIEVYKKVFNQSKILNGNIIDVGCAWGRMFRLYQNLNKKIKIYGVDISKEMISEAKKNKVKANLKVSPAEKIPFKKDMFDNVMCLAMFDATFQEKTIKELFRVTKPKGKIFLTGKNNNYYKTDKPALLAEINARKKKHPNFFTDVNKLIKIISKSSNIIKSYYFLRRGDFGKFKYKKLKPKKFYEFLFILEKRKNLGKIYKFSHKFSETYKNL